VRKTTNVAATDHATSALNHETVFQEYLSDKFALCAAVLAGRYYFPNFARRSETHPARATTSVAGRPPLLLSVPPNATFTISDPLPPRPPLPRRLNTTHPEAIPHPRARHVQPLPLRVLQVYEIRSLDHGLDP
jgi:hypothetical protein